MLEVIDLCADWIVAAKPFGVLSEEKDGEASMPALIRDYLTEAGKPFEAVYPVHRLDRTTEGLMVYALTKRGAGILSRTVTDGTFHKTYLAYITADESLPTSGEMRDFLYFDRRRDKAFVVTGGRKGAKEAILTYTLDEPFEWRGHSLTPARIELLTGRTHQIRVQFASRRSPLAGDGKYGSRVNFKGASLFCVGLRFPWEGEEKIYSREIPVNSEI